MKKAVMCFIGAMMVLSLAACTPTMEKHKVGEVQNSDMTVPKSTQGPGVVTDKTPDLDAPDLDIISIYTVSEDGSKLEGTMEGVNNYCIAVKEKGDDIVFLRKIVKGGADKSYGIQVAKLAGVPDSVIARAKELVEELSQADISVKAKSIAEESQAKAKQKAKPKKYDEVDLEQISLFDAVKDDDVVKELQELDISNMTPMDAMNTLYRLQNKLKNRW